MKRMFVMLVALSLWMTSLMAGEIGRWKGPWGKDANLVKEKVPPEQDQGGQVRSGWLEHLAVSAIWFHKKVISPADGPRSHFRPNSSQYTIDAIERYGFWHGYLLGCDRLMRENPEVWIYRTLLVDNNWVTKWDPVR